MSIESSLAELAGGSLHYHRLRAARVDREQVSPTYSSAQPVSCLQDCDPDSMLQEDICAPESSDASSNDTNVGLPPFESHLPNYRVRTLTVVKVRCSKFTARSEIDLR